MSDKMASLFLFNDHFVVWRAAFSIAIIDKVWYFLHSLCIIA